MIRSVPACAGSIAQVLTVVSPSHCAYNPSSLQIVQLVTAAQRRHLAALREDEYANCFDSCFPGNFDAPADTRCSFARSRPEHTDPPTNPRCEEATQRGLVGGSVCS